MRDKPDEDKVEMAPDWTEEDDAIFDEIMEEIGQEDQEATDE